MACDNTEPSDVDIFDITDPANPEFIADLDLFNLPEVAEIADDGAQGNEIFHHGAVVKKVGDQMRMLVACGDVGYVELDVDDPANPTFIADTDYDDPDPLTGFDPPEGNANQAEFSFDNEFFLAADEDFAPHRLVSRIDEAPYANEAFASALSVAEPFQPGQLLTEDTIVVGSACTGTVAAATPTGPRIAVAERGVCPGGFQKKVTRARTPATTRASS